MPSPARTFAAQLALETHAVDHEPFEDRAHHGIGSVPKPDVGARGAYPTSPPAKEEPASFFYDGDRPPRAEELANAFRLGILTIARATPRAEPAWPQTTLDSLDG